VQELERDLAIELGIVRRIHDTHAAHAELVEDDVAIDSCAALELGRILVLPFGKPVGHLVDEGLAIVRERLTRPRAHVD
jgi:hypothetical protein